MKKKYVQDSNESREVVELQTDSYEISDIYNFKNKQITSKELEKEVFELKANNNNLRSETKCKLYIHFS